MKKYIKKAAAIAAAAVCAVSAVQLPAYAEDAVLMIEDPSNTQKELLHIEELTNNENVKEYYNKIISDMSWYTSKTEYISMQDVTGDGVPEFIVTDNYGMGDKETSGKPYSAKTMRKFYSLEGETAELMYAVSMSRNYLTKAETEGSWLYSDFTESLSEDGSYEMNREYGIMSFGKSNVTKVQKFTARESIDAESDSFFYFYKKDSKVYAKDDKKGYSKKKKVLDRISGLSYDKWYEDAGMWEYKNFEGDTTYLLEAVPTFTVDNGEKAHKEKNGVLLKVSIAELADKYVNSPEELCSTHSYMKHYYNGLVYTCGGQYF